MFDRIGFLFAEATTAMRRNLTMSFAAVVTAAVSLYLIGGLGYVYLRTTQYAASLTGRFEMRVMLRDGTSADTISATANTIRQMDGVSGVYWIPRDKAWAADKAREPELYGDVENPYPDAFKVTLSNLHNSDRIAEKIRALPAVAPGEESVQYLKDVQQFVENGLYIIRWVGGAISGLLFVAAGMLIFNAIKLTVVARRVEIRVMQLVGASRFTIRFPFLIEGVVQGAAGGMLAGALLLLSNQALVAFLRQIPNGAGFSAPPPFPLWQLTALLCAIGAAYGLICSNAAIHSPLKFR